MNSEEEANCQTVQLPPNFIPSNAELWRMHVETKAEVRQLNASMSAGFKEMNSKFDQVAGGWRVITTAATIVATFGAFFGWVISQVFGGKHG